MGGPLKLLFVCGRNKRRSPTAERLYRNDPRFEVRSAGTGETSRRTVSSADLEWADLVLVMERRYERHLRPLLRECAEPPAVASLDIPDEYEFMDTELCALLRDAVEARVAEL
jgi:predicted protein tyrosine phosphatase